MSSVLSPVVIPTSSHTLSVVPVRSRQHLRQFVRFPYQLYASYPAWVAPLERDRHTLLHKRRNPFFQHATAQLWLALHGSSPVGTIAAYVDHLAPAEQRGCFGCFECVDDLAVARALLDTAAAWVQAHGAPSLRGPFNFAADNDCGVLLDAYDQPPTLMTTYNPPYYPALLTQAGFVKETDWYAYTIDPQLLGMTHTNALPPRLARAVALARQRSRATLRPINVGQFQQEFARAQAIYNQAWAANEGFVPMTDAEVAELAYRLRPFIAADLIYFAEDAGRPVGMSIALPDLHQVLHPLRGRLLPFGWWRVLRWQQHVDTLRFFAMGVLPAYRRQGIEALFYAETLQAALRHGYRRAELSLVVESNMSMRHSAEAFGAQIAKTYRVYSRSFVHRS
ncbi:MAG: GNAT family N-acetyltransferase [Chloroflexaceae bacterium]|nr:GNAT family N-acetyltransferase [Chloroflexaceae bacterium]